MSDETATVPADVDPFKDFLEKEEERELIVRNARVEMRADIIARLASPAPLGAPSSGKVTRRRFAHWYEAVIDWLLVNPGGSIRDCAKALGRGENTVYAVMSSDIFKTRYAQRRAEHSAMLSASIIETQENLALDVLSELHNRVRDNPAKLSTQALQNIADSTLQRLGYGAPTPQAPGASAVVVNIDARVVEEARTLARNQQMRLLTQEASEEGKEQVA